MSIDSLENMLMLGATMRSRFTELKAECDKAQADLGAARALLTQTLTKDDEAIADMKELGCMEALPADAFDLTERIRDFLAGGAA
ncbi:hypothetical protein SAMN05428959_1011150 [Duganella sp. CF517]|uniref:hypothetical protein n=1 Tax=Duganella sp. CF517 TaxID=1881038 RepID=UPI0008C6A43B|nr:hypothetical protein [Duganella sp. CF517]SEN31757.1 hypothetical protein SAMN05428959_1011150 [Duganella sp. CF517]